MILPFTLTINDKPNFFVEKIWKGLLENGLAVKKDLLSYQEKYKNLTNQNWNNDTSLKPKIHTIRRGNRWSVGLPIIVAIEILNKELFSFSPAVSCISIQEIQISYDTGFQVLIDGKILELHVLKALATNDGFKDLDDFKFYFNIEFKGQIIHWTNFSYSLSSSIKM